MKNGELLKKLEDFLSDLGEHRDLWKNARGRSYGTTRILVVKNQEQLENQKKILNQNFGGLEKYLEALLPGRGLMGNSFGTRNVWLTAIGDFQDLDKGKSMEFFISHLNQAIGKLKEEPLDTEFNNEALSENSSTPYEKVLVVLKRFDACWNHLKSMQKYQISSEADVRDLLYVMLRSCFENVEIEEPTPKAAGKFRKMDIVVKDSKTIVEVKSLLDKSNNRDLQEEINGDLIGYANSGYEAFVAFIYDPLKLVADPQLLRNSYKAKQSKSSFKFVDVIVK